VRVMAQLGTGRDRDEDGEQQEVNRSKTASSTMIGGGKVSPVEGPEGQACYNPKEASHCGCHHVSGGQQEACLWRIFLCGRHCLPGRQC
jgi:hypothetical protein